MTIKLTDSNKKAIDSIVSILNIILDQYRAKHSGGSDFDIDNLSFGYYVDGKYIKLDSFDGELETNLEWVLKEIIPNLFTR